MLECDYTKSYNLSIKRRIERRMDISFYMIERGYVPDGTNPDHI